MIINSLVEIDEELVKVIKEVEAMDSIKGDTVDNVLQLVEKRLYLLREIVDYKMGRTD